MSAARVLLTTTALFILGAWFLLLRPTFLSGPAAYVMVSGESMEPTLYTGDLVVTRKHSDYRTGDIVAFRVEGGIVIHRIVGVAADDGFVVRGDNKEAPDLWRPKAENIVGKQWLHVPGAGRTLARLREPPHFAALVAGMASFSFFGGKEIKRRRRRGKHMASNHYSHGSSSGSGGIAAPWWAVAGLGLTGLASLALCVLAFQAVRRPEVKTRSLERARYEHKAAFDYTILAQPSTLYPGGVIGPVLPPPELQVAGKSGGTAPAATVDAPPVYTKQARQIDLGFSYALAAPAPPEVRGELSAELLIKATGEGGWTVRQPLLQPAPFEGTSTRARLTVDFVPIQGLIDTIEKETGFTPGAYELVISPVVKLNGTVSGRAINETYSPTFTLKYTKTTITPDAGLRRSEPKSIADPLTERQEVRLLALTLSMREARLAYGAAMVVAVAFAAVFAAVVFLGLGQDEMTRVRARYGTKLVPVTQADHGGSNVVQVSRLEDLAVLASRDGKIIFNQKLPDGDLYFVPDGLVTYEYAIRNDLPRYVPPLDDALRPPPRSAKLAPEDYLPKRPQRRSNGAGTGKSS